MHLIVVLFIFLVAYIVANRYGDAWKFAVVGSLIGYMVWYYNVPKLIDNIDPKAVLSIAGGFTAAMILHAVLTWSKSKPVEKKEEKEN